MMTAGEINGINSRLDDVIRILTEHGKTLQDHGTRLDNLNGGIGTAKWMLATGLVITGIIVSISVPILGIILAHSL